MIRQDRPGLMYMALPLMVSFWMRAAVTFVDTIYAALLGDAAVAAIGLSVPFEFLMIALWVGLSTGLTSGLSRALGARAWVRMDQYRRAAWRLVALLGPLFTVVGAGIWFFAPRVGLEADTGRAFQVYGTTLIAGSAFTSFWSIIPDSLVKAHQDTRSTMWAGILSNVINVVLNTLFLFAFHWGVFGIALSTVLSRIGGLAYAVLRAGMLESRRRATPPADEAPDRSPYRRILALAVPSSAAFVLMAFETGLVNGLLARLERATEAIAAYSIYYRVVLFSLQPVIAIAVAMLPYAASRAGSGNLDAVRRGLREAVVASAAYSILLLGPLMWFLAPWLAASLAETDLTAHYATFALRTVPLACLAGALFLLCRPVFEAYDRGKPGLWMAVLRYVILTVPLAWAGIAAASRMDYPVLYGLIVGLLVAAAVPSVLFYVWLQAALPAMAREARGRTGGGT